jgi:hypothetical protein
MRRVVSRELPCSSKEITSLFVGYPESDLTSVSEEDFAKDASRNRFAVLLSRTNHLSYHLGQAVFGLK